MHQLSRDLNMWIVVSNFVLMHLKVLKHLISSLWSIVVSQCFLNINTTLKVKIYSWLWPLWWEKWCQSPVVFLVSVLKSLLTRIVSLLLLNSLLWYSLQVFVETFQQLQHLILWIFLIFNFIFKNIQGKHSGLLHTCLKQYSHS